jgi:hypothetical protein
MVIGIDIEEDGFVAQLVRVPMVIGIDIEEDGFVAQLVRAVR